MATGEIVKSSSARQDKAPANWLKIITAHQRAKEQDTQLVQKMRREENISRAAMRFMKLRREMIFIPDDQLDEFVASATPSAPEQRGNSAAIGYGGVTIVTTLPKLKRSDSEYRLVLRSLGGLELLPLLFELGQAVGDGHAAVAVLRVNFLRVVLAQTAAAAAHELIQRRG